MIQYDQNKSERERVAQVAVLAWLVAHSHTWLRVAPSLYPAGSLVRYSCSSLAPGIKAYQQICVLTAPRLPQGTVSAPVHRAQLLPTRSFLHSFTTTVYINNNLTTTTSITQICAQHRARRSSALATPVAAGPSPYHLNCLSSVTLHFTHTPSLTHIIPLTPLFSHTYFFFFILNNDKP